ncbi:hypothetical protein BP6252_13884 [Coleophoma cylindrospora]|uniref:Uncharacterized protein n=1 Tax=Coleophoma cylindrospora TaxID=1849047 RepID=A0A3D8Q5G9_9HELO|nr:hypothetical protein BP6252_13884 [Coleophoma cylindrospora]
MLPEEDSSQVLRTVAGQLTSADEALPADQNEGPKEAYNTLQFALFRNQVSIASRLLRDFENINARGGHFGNAIQAAAFGGHEDMVLRLLQQGADPNSEGRYGSALRAASLCGHDKVVRLLLDSGARLADTQADALQAAAFTGKLSTIKLLLDSHYNLRRLTSLRPALEAASSRGHCEAVQLLLQDQKNKLLAGFALIAALKSGQEHVIEALLPYLPSIIACHAELRGHYGRGSPFHEILDDSLKPFQLDKRSLPSSIQINDQTLSISQAESQSHQTIHDIAFDSVGLEALDSVRKCSYLEGVYDFQIKSILKYAAQNCSKPIFEALLNHNLDMDYKFHDPHRTPLETAASAGNSDVVELLLDRGALLKRALEFAIKSGHQNIVRLALSRRPDTDVDMEVIEAPTRHYCQSFDGISYSTLYYLKCETRSLSAQNALPLAVEQNNWELITILLDHKMRSARPGLGYAFIVAARNGNDDVVNLMIKRGKDARSLNIEPGSQEQFVVLQSVREAATKGHTAVIKSILMQPEFEHIQDMVLFEALGEAVASRMYDTAEQLRSIGGSALEEERMAGITLVSLSGKRVKKGYNNLQEARILLRENFALKDRSPVFETYYREAIRTALKAGTSNLSIAMVLLEQDLSQDYFANEKDILQLSIRENGYYVNFFEILLEIIQALIAHGASVTSMDDEGKTPLYYACVTGLSNVFHVLIEGGADIHKKYEAIPNLELDNRATEMTDLDSTKVNLLQIALDSRLEHETKCTVPSIWTDEVQTRWGDIIMFLLNAGMRVNPDNPSLAKFLHVACFQGMLTYVERLLRIGVDINSQAARINKHDYDRGTALHAATIGGQTAVVSCLLRHGADIHAKRRLLEGSKYSPPQTALKAALGTFIKRPGMHKVLKACEVLVVAGASEDDCQTLLEYSAKHGKFDVVRRLLQRGIRIQQIPIPTPASFSLEMISCLLEIGMELPPSQAAKLQREAVKHGDVDAMKFLVERNGPLLPMTDFLRMSQEMFRRPSFEMLRYIITEYGLHIDVKCPISDGSPYSTNMLQIACGRLFKDAIKVLLELGADPDCPGLPESVFLYIFRQRKGRFGSQAFQAKKIHIAQLLLDYGVDINGTKRIEDADDLAQAPMLEPPILCAVASGNLDMTKFLIERGADVNRGGLPPLRLARERGHTQIARLLVENGAVDDVNRPSLLSKDWDRKR